MDQMLLQVENLTMRYNTRSPFRNSANSVCAVDDVSFSIPRGAIMGLIGESGCGKTSVGKTLLSLTPPTSGRVLFDGKVIFDVEENSFLSPKELQKIRKQMQIVFQDPYSALDPKRTILQTVSEGAVKHRLVSRKDAYGYAQHYLQMCGIPESALLRYPHEFSGGQRQRINIARSLALQPEFLVCDEITAALDVSIQSQILNLLLDLREQQKLTMLIISHNIDVVRYLCDFVAVMYLGKIVEMADAKTLYESPAHPYTQALLAAIPKREPWEADKKLTLQKQIPQVAQIPGGCRFHPRCPRCTQQCTGCAPSMQEIQPNHFVACWNT